VYFPLASKLKFKKKYPVVSAQLPKRDLKETDLKKKISSHFTSKELEKLKTAFDHVGSIAIVEVDVSLAKKAKFIGKALLDLVPSVKTVLKKEGRHEGEFRTQNMKLLAGVNTRETMHRENGVSLWLDVEKVYFSPRLSNERKRIMQLVKPGEVVLVMFSGCGVYPCVLSRNTAARAIYGVELNLVGHQYGLRNVVANKLKNVFLFNGDVRNVVPTLGKKFDRILMPLPKSSEEFLDVAFTVSRHGTVIHCYDFLHEDHFQDAVVKIKKACAVAGKKCRILGIFKCGQHSPHVFRICVDFEVA
ncbi:MAG: class I SAM-dependent methyltransferase family protein, partial [Nanoarchaeota archaeon]